ncbi:hypothetical protein K461DRAFT_291648 [Myriangium duriaei CBS 260.36]|uniref:Uncharacterized protein n=1 Tax=Myriangium duriaei CBS 260.36 TaxID=1168546 RepID=A0A9P4J9E9_9PEZI|nr:hypothetical protein K461DRAFT_291648 [Myriangium duriaei CBS 260.36]
MNHFAPHPGSQFEGYYSKFDLPSGARLALIISNVPNAKDRAHLVSFTYVPKGSTEYFQREIFIDSMEMVKTSPDGSFELRASPIGSMKVEADSTTTYTIKHEDFTFSGKTTTHQPWSSTTDTPEDLLVHLPLPLHWHVHSLAAACDFAMSIPSFAVPKADHSGTATVHQEKNWAQSFPSAHIWIQARDYTTSSTPFPQRSVCIAGGKILGTEAYLMGYRSTTHPAATKEKPFELDFRPPYAMRLLSLSPTLTTTPEFEKRQFKLSATSWTQRIDVTAKAPEDTFFPLSAPFPNGHLDNLLAESFAAEIKVKVYGWRWGPRWWDMRGWWTGSGKVRKDVGWWEVEEEVVFQNASLEFGGGYYGFAGSETRRAR